MIVPSVLRSDKNDHAILNTFYTAISNRREPESENKGLSGAVMHGFGRIGKARLLLIAARTYFSG